MLEIISSHNSLDLVQQSSQFSFRNRELFSVNKTIEKPSQPRNRIAQNANDDTTRYYEKLTPLDNLVENLHKRNLIEQDKLSLPSLKPSENNLKGVRKSLCVNQCDFKSPCITAKTKLSTYKKRIVDNSSRKMNSIRKVEYSKLQSPKNSSKNRLEDYRSQMLNGVKLTQLPRPI